MAQVYLGLGSNIRPAANLQLAICALRHRFGRLALSPVYRNAPVGFAGDDFLNMVVGLETGLAPQAVIAQLEQIHQLAGRRRTGKVPGPRELDIDLLLYDQAVLNEPGLRLPRADVLEYDFVLRPLAELAPDFIHPVTGRDLASHWREHEPTHHSLIEECIDLEGSS